MNRFADIHCHSTLRPVAYYIVDQKSENNSVWFQKKPTLRQRKKKRFPLYTQTDYTTLYHSNTKLIFLTISPLEQGWFSPKWTIFRLVKYAIYPMILLSRAVLSIRLRFINSFIRLLVGLPLKYIRLVQHKKRYLYFNTLQQEYNYISDKIRWKNNNDSYELIKQGGELSKFSERLQVVLTVEGAHSFSQGNAKDFIIDESILPKVQENIEKVKQTWEFPLFYVTLCHHFYNGLSGHVKTIYSSGLIGGLFSRLLDQKKGRDTGISYCGWRVIDQLLGLTGDSKKRVLIDIKHMSVTARKEYYRFVQDYNDNPEHTKIPIIFSHGGYSGCKTMDELISQPDSQKKYNKSDSDFNICSINLSDEEIRIINKSGGIIGLSLDQRILSGRKVVKEASKIKDLSEMNIFWGNQVFKNILHMAKAVIDDPDATEDQLKGIWNCISIGSDFDGMINPADAFIWANDYDSLEVQLINEFDKWQDKRYFLGLDEYVLIRGIMHDNAFEFAKKHFH